MKRFAAATKKRNDTETNVPITPPTALNEAKRFSRAPVARAMATEAIITIVEWPSEKKNPTATGR